MGREPKYARDSNPPRLNSAPQALSRKAMPPPGGSIEAGRIADGDPKTNPNAKSGGSIVPAVLMERIYLFVPPEEYAEAQASGARWDDVSKRWYIDGDGASAAYSRWLGDEEEPGFGIASEEAFVASAQTSCVRCRESIEVICIYCESGADRELGEPLRQFTVSNVWAMDSALAAQIARWRFYARGLGSSAEEDCFTNHCPHCGAAQEDYLLHAEPGDVFFGLSRADPGPVEFTQLEGRVEVSGDYSFEV